MIPSCDFGDDTHAFVWVGEVGRKEVEALSGWVDGGSLGVVKAFVRRERMGCVYCVVGP